MSFPQLSFLGLIIYFQTCLITYAIFNALFYLPHCLSSCDFNRLFLSYMLLLLFCSSTGFWLGHAVAQWLRLALPYLVKSEILTSYIYGPTFGNAESSLFLFAAKCFNIQSMKKVILCHSCV
jgi:hypothetical protein